MFLRSAGTCTYERQSAEALTRLQARLEILAPVIAFNCKKKISHIRVWPKKTVHMPKLLVDVVFPPSSHVYSHLTTCTNKNACILPKYRVKYKLSHDYRL